MRAVEARATGIKYAVYKKWIKRTEYRHRQLTNCDPS